MYPTESGEGGSWSSSSAFFQEPKPMLFLCMSATPTDSGQFSKLCSPQTGFLRAVCPSRRALCFPHCLLWPLGRVTLEPRFSTLHPRITWKERADGAGLWSSSKAALHFLQVLPFACWSRAGGSKATTTRTANHLPRGSACTPSLRYYCTSFILCSPTTSTPLH